MIQSEIKEKIIELHESGKAVGSIYSALRKYMKWYKRPSRGTIKNIIERHKKNNLKIVRHEVAADDDDEYTDYEFLEDEYLDVERLDDDQIKHETHDNERLDDQFEEEYLEDDQDRPEEVEQIFKEELLEDEADEQKLMQFLLHDDDHSERQASPNEDTNVMHNSKPNTFVIHVIRENES